MEYLEQAIRLLAGETLAQRLAATGPLKLESLVDIMMQVGAGLQRAHENDIVHRDVKPEDIVLVPSRDDDGVEVDVVKICDFGIAQGQTTGNTERVG